MEHILERALTARTCTVRVRWLAVELTGTLDMAALAMELSNKGSETESGFLTLNEDSYLPPQTNLRVYTTLHYLEHLSSTTGLLYSSTMNDLK